MLSGFFNHHNSRGDTLIEVLIAVTIFSLVAVGGVSVMNQGAATAQRSLEITLVRQEIDAQAEALRFLNATYNSAFVKNQLIANYSSEQAKTWMSIQTTNPVSKFGVDANNKCPQPSATSFVVNTRTLKLQPINTITPDSHSITYAKVNFDLINNQKISSVDGLWVEAIKGAASANSDYIDFHIRACWDSLGQNIPITIGTIVRLYEPK